SHLCGNSGSRSARFSIARWRNEQCARPHNDSLFISLQGFLINSRHFRIAWNDVTRSIIGRYLDQYASMLCHREPNHCLILDDVDLRLAYVEIRRRLRAAYGGWHSLDDATRARSTTRLSTRHGRGLLCVQNWVNRYEQ